LGARNAIFAAGLNISGDLQVDAFNTEQSGFDAAQQLINSSVRFDAIFAASDLIGIGAIRAIEAAGLTIPGDIAVIGFDDIPAASLAHPPLTTVQQDYRTAGEVLVDTLLKLIEGKSAESYTLPAKLVVRKSCGAH
jgi:DNA-binding LacI/PurR family transcriptional regulator